VPSIIPHFKKVLISAPII
jgi:hypothetical protein